MSVDDLIGVAPYSPWWWIIAIVLVVLLVAWFIALPILTRRRAAKLYAPPAPPKPLRPGQHDPVREEYRQRIQVLAQRRAAGEITDRTLHLELSATLREYVKIRIGVRADTMTLTDLQADPTTRGVADVIERCYHPAFSQGSAMDAQTEHPAVLEVTVREALNVVGSI